MTRIALISDIHANEVALRAVIAEIRRTGVDQVICLGDVATLGPRPNAVIECWANSAAVASWGTMTSSSSMRSWFAHTLQRRKS